MAGFCKLAHLLVSCGFGSGVRIVRRFETIALGQDRPGDFDTGGRRVLSDARKREPLKDGADEVTGKAPEISADRRVARSASRGRVTRLRELQRSTHD
jgi:hypothetical protein